tara:strand:+ start:12888 stop:14027 length:1140 start_codon:yes stop_codon:yes gene_type:complete
MAVSWRKIITDNEFADSTHKNSNVDVDDLGAPAITDATKFLNGAGAWTSPEGAGVRTVTAGSNTLASSETLAFTEGSNITITESGGAVTITGTAGPLTLIDEDNMATDSATRPPSQQSVKAYVDGQEHTPETADISDVSVTATELGQLETLGTTSISSANWVALSNLSGTNSGNQTVAYSSAIATGNNGLVPSAGSAGQFLKHDGTFGSPSYVPNTDVSVSKDNLEATLALMDTSYTIGNDTDVDGTISGKLTVNGDLDVKGTTTTINSANTSFTDTSLLLNVADGETAFGSGASSITFGCSTGATSSGRIINVGSADGGFKFYTGNATNTPAGNNNQSAGGTFADVWCKELRLEVLGSAPGVVAGGFYASAAGFYVAY